MGYILSICDSNLHQLANKDVGLLNSNESRSLAKYDKKTQKFIINIAPYIAHPDGSDKLPDKIFQFEIYRTFDMTAGGVNPVIDFDWDVFGKNALDTSSLWSIPVPYVYAEYRIILNDF